jgi:hypothetical protein
VLAILGALFITGSSPFRSKPHRYDTTFTKDIAVVALPSCWSQPSGQRSGHRRQQIAQTIRLFGERL